MTKEINNKELYQEILEVYKHYMVDDKVQFEPSVPSDALFAQDPHKYQKIPTIYETVPTTVSNRS